MTRLELGHGGSVSKRGPRSVAFALCVAASGCAAAVDPAGGGEAAISEPVATTAEALTISTLLDDSVAPVHVQIKVCKDENLATEHVVDCTVDSGYTAFGGGAFAEFTNNAGAMLTMSAPIADGRTWRGASKDRQVQFVAGAGPHKLTTFAVGIRLDGVHAVALRDKIRYVANTAPPVAAPTASISMLPFAITGGASTSTTGPGQFLTRTSLSSSGAWTASSKEHLGSSPGTVTAHEQYLETTGIIEGFGALEIQQVSGNVASVNSGTGTATASVSSGFALAGFGARAITTSGAGRMLFRIGPNGNARSVIVSSKDHGSGQGNASAGSTIASVSQVRKKAGTHGLCNPGAKLTASVDSCVASICAADPFCCNNSWDNQCVSEVTSICGQSCDDHTCTIPEYGAAYWNDPLIRWLNNCYNYALNVRTDDRAQPGETSGEYCETGNTACITAANMRKFAAQDGLIPTTLAAGCSDNRTLLALVIKAGEGYHWLRRDSDGMWSHKPGEEAATNLDFSGAVITNPQTANLAPTYNEFVGYYCACSSHVQGHGHTIPYSTSEPQE